MTCRHPAGYHDNDSHYTPPSNTPDPDKFEILEVVSVGKWLVMKVQYLSCAGCSFEAKKVLVVEATLQDAIYWRKIDPHFRERSRVKGKKEAPGPRARFPGDAEGWQDALQWAQSKR